MTVHNEKLRSVEHISPQEEKSVSASGRLDVKSIEQVLNKQAEMLLSIEHDIDSSQFDFLCEKIEYENTVLLKILEIDAQHLQTNKQLNRTLKAEHFTQKRLDANLI